MSSNFFAALDDSDEEGAPASVPSTSVAKVSTPATKKVEVVEPSKRDESKRPNQNDRNTKFGRGGRPPARDGKRTYDRRSGTGRGKEIKKDGGGSRNWGSDKNEARNAEHVAVEDELVETEEKISQTAPEQDENEVTEIEPEKETEPEPEDNTISYEEYLARKKEKEASSLLAPVKTRDVDDEFKHVKPQKLVEEDFLVLGGSKQKRNRDKKAEKTPTDVAADLLSFRIVSDNDRRGRGRGREGGRDGGRGSREEGRGGRDGFRGGRDGGRGGREEGRGGRDGFRGGRDGYRGRGRGGRGRGGGRGRNEINVMDETAFPSL